LPTQGQPGVSRKADQIGFFYPLRENLAQKTLAEGGV